MKNNGWLKKVVAAVTLVGMIFAGAWAMDARYAKAADVQAQIQGVYNLVLEMKLIDKRRELAELKVIERKRELTDRELIAKEILQQEIKTLEAQLGK